jgi:general secretion pathway protein H
LTSNRHRSSTRALRRRRAGMSIIEVMIVTLIIALAATGANYAFGAMERTQLRSACLHVAAAARYAYNRAVSRGTTVRLALDFDQQTVSIQEAHGRVVLTRATDPNRDDVLREGDERTDVSSVDPWAAARARLQDSQHVSFGGSPFEAIDGSRYAPHPVGSGIVLVKLLSPHEPEPRDSGLGSIYFFANGQTEHSVIWIADHRRPDAVFSIEIHPLTGRTRVRDHAYEPDELLDQGADRPTSEVRD